MKRKSTSQSAFFNARILVGSLLCLTGIFVAIGVYSAQPRTQTRGPAPAVAAAPDVVQMIGPVRLNQDLRYLPFVAPKPEFEEQALTRYPHGRGTGARTQEYPHVQALIDNALRPEPNMPAPLLTFDGIARVNSGCNCAPPDTNGDVGPNHYIQAVNVAFKIFDKSGNTLAGPTTYNSFFASLTGTPCANANDGDPFVFYDHQANRWVISDFAFPSFPGSSFYQCIGVSQTGDPVAGGWYLYAIQIDPANPNLLGDYPKFAMWNDGGTQNAYFFTVNLFANPTTFNGVRAFALNRTSMLTGGPANAIAFTIPLASLGDTYSLVAANFRTGNAPPAGRDEMLLAVDSPGTENVSLTQVKGWKFHVDFAIPGNSTLGVGANHTPNAVISVNPFVDAFTNAAGFAIVPQTGTATKLDTLGDKIMTPLVYQNIGGTESLWADQTILPNFPNGPTAVRWYQFIVTGGTFPASAAQQQDWTNGNDGVWRFMPSIAADQSGNVAIGYSASSSTLNPGMRYAGRLAGDPANNLGQGEATMFTGAGSQTSPTRWGDYSMTTVDSSDGISFWHTNEYYATNSSFNWSTRVGKFQFPAGGPCNLAWQAAANMPLDFYGGSTASNGTYAYVAGGYSFSSGQSLNSLYRYDPGANTWTALPSYAGAGFIEGLAVYYPTTNRIYVFGGEDAVSGTNYNNTRIFDIASGTWLADGAPMPDVHSFMAGGYIPADGKIYVLSGYNTGDVTSAQPNTWRYDPVANTWTDLTGTVAYPHPAGGMAFGVINNHIYTAGGRDAANTVINLTYDFNPTALTYTQKANEPGTNNNVPGSGVAMNLLFAFGGGNPFVAPGAPSTNAAFGRPEVKAGKIEIPSTTNSTVGL